MDVSEFSNRLRSRLCPEMYQHDVDGRVEPFTLLLRTGHWYSARYALAVLPWNAVVEPSTLLSVARRATRQRILTVPFLLQVGLYLIVVGPKAGWSPLASSAKADQTSLHAVIVQGVHFLDLRSGASVVNRSRWGPIQFGGTAAVSRAVEEVLD